MWDSEGLKEAMREFGWSMDVILSRYPSLHGIVKRNIDAHAALDQRQMFSVQDNGMRMQIRSTLKPNIKRDAFAMLILFMVKLGKLPEVELFILTGKVMVKALMLCNTRMRVYKDKSTSDYAVYLGEPADVWFGIMKMITSCIFQLLHNTAENARGYHKVATSTRLALLMPMLPHEAKLHSWLKLELEVCRLGLSAYRVHGVKWVDIVHSFALWFKTALSDGFPAVSARTFNDELLALREAGCFPESLRENDGDDEDDKLIPELDSTDIAGTSSSASTKTGSKGSSNELAKLRRKVKLLEARKRLDKR